MFHDLDATLRALLEDANAPAELRQADVSFETPGKDFAPGLATVDLFLRDVREHAVLRDPVPVIEQQADGNFIRVQPPLRVECCYLVTTWADSSQTADLKVLSEHRLLGQALAWLRQFPTIPASYLQGSLAAQELPPPTVVARPADGRDTGEYWTWSALGIAPRPSLDLSVTISMDIARSLVEGPPVLTSEVRLPAGSAFEIAGTVRQAGAPVSQARITLEPGGQATVTDALGRYSLAGLLAGSYQVQATSADGLVTAQAAIEVPAAGLAGYDVSLPP